MKILQLIQIFVLIVPSFSFATETLKKRTAPLKLSTSVIIPCVAKHFKHIPGLLHAYAKQTKKPNEIVISVSNTKDLTKSDLATINQRKWPFKLKIIKNKGKKSAGENRNIAVNNSTGNIILCQDADDIPHPQRVEIVYFIFTNYHIDHLMHSLTRDHQQFIDYNKDAVLVRKMNIADAYSSNIHLTNGCPCFTRKVAQRIKWGSSFVGAEDVEFNKMAYQLFKDTAIIDTQLLHYRNEFSSFRAFMNMFRIFMN